VKTPYELAIEAGVRAYWLEGQAVGIIFKHNTYDDMDRFIRDGLVAAFTKGVEAVLRAAPHLAPPIQTTPAASSLANGAGEGGLNSEQVERVARAILEAAGLWPERWQKWELEARAAVAAMGGGTRWGVWNLDCTKPIHGWYWWRKNYGEPRNFVTTDEEAAHALVNQLNCEEGGRYEVREYAEQAKGKTAEEIAHDCLSPVTFWWTPHQKQEAHARITAAIENARKGADCGNH
jgi:hypothetical protein